MRILRQYTDVPGQFRGGVVAVGNFDGVHLGHRAVIDQAKRIARDLGAPLAVLTFEPHPREFFAPKAPPFRLTPFRTKSHLLQDLGVDLLLALAFDRALSLKPADEFVRDVLVDGMAARHVVVGYDFAFGHKRGGNAERLHEIAARSGFAVTAVEPAGDDGLVYSSTRIRDCLWQSQPHQAADLLGHWWEVEGHVQRGDQRGRQLGFPTANFAVDGYVEPTFGVYAVRVGEETDRGVVWRDGVANLGRRPTFGEVDTVLEAHLLDFSGDLYGKLLRVAFVDFIRPERKFDGIEALKRQIATDRTTAERLLAAPDNRADRFGG